MTVRTDFAVLGTQRVAARMGVALPVFKGCVRTPLTPRGGGILIGCLHQANRGPHDFTSSEEQLQAALLESRTAKPLPLLQRIAGAVWRWC